MVALTRSEMTVVPAPSAVKTRSFARRALFIPASKLVHAQMMRSHMRRAQAIGTNSNAMMSLSHMMDEGPDSRPARTMPTIELQIAMLRVHHGKQDAYRFVPPGRNTGCGRTWSKS
ncbi:hypothetical protein WJT86_07835 [Microvirga sp. W0021]|uniref:Uncharacterized protein n=1 Tax=Hohaiivirga grylli TaxID=3133970 RepID=A0ABV0BMC6_9HYPH